jgi:atypical dual specificity phosphatase
MQRWLARAIYYPTLGYNLLMGRVLGIRRWWDAVDEQLLLGARPMPGDPQRFHDLGITGVVNLCEELAGPTREYQQLGIEQLWIPTVDFNHPSSEDVDRGADFIQRHLEDGGKVYVHCKAGRARSATVVLWWLIKYRGMSPMEAQARILKARPHSNPRIYQRPVIQELLASRLQDRVADSQSAPSE